MMRTFLLLALLTPVLGDEPRKTDTDRDADLSGAYSSSGINPDGSSYDGVVHIVKHNNAYQLQWLMDSQLVAIGMGIRSGDVLAVTYFSTVPGVVAYRIEPGNRLVGEWTVIGADGELFSETLTRVSPAASSGVPSPPRRERKTPTANTREL